MSKQLNRKPLMVNQRSGIKQSFQYVEPKVKSIANPSIFTYSSPAKGTKGETINATNTAASLIFNRNAKPIQS